MSLLLAGFLTVHSILSSSDIPQLISTNEGGRIDLKAPQHPGKLLNCTLKTSASKVYSIYPENTLNGEYIGKEEYCGHKFMDIDSSYAGLWNMTTITTEGNYTDQFKIRVQREIKVVPGKYISARLGHWIYVTLKSNETDIRSCNVTTPPNFKKFNLMTDDVEDLGLSLWGNCGVRMLASNSVRGQWELYEQVGEYIINHGLFHINIPYESNSAGSETEVIEHTWVLGDTGKTINLDDRSVFCQLERPDGTKLPLQYGNCRSTVPVVSEHHKGTWRASYAVEGKIELEHKEIVIKTKDRRFLECSYSAGKGEEINLLCRAGESVLKFCTFIRPDNHLINLPAGVGNENYTYYGKGFDKYAEDREYGECGVTIRKPSAVDFGVWTCEMGMPDGIRGSVINVPKTRSGEIDRENNIQNPTVYVKRGDSFKIGCKGSSKLDYCWFTSPNGTAYSVSTEGSSSKTFKYEGKGFSMGECGAIVPTSNMTDSGKWICHLGYAGGFEVEQDVPVKVTESYLIASDDVVRVTENTKLACRTYNVEDGTLKYCRWVRPNGHGINSGDASRYKLSQEIDKCVLTISDYQPEDVGKWMCLAALTRLPNQEEWATIELKSSTMEEEARIASLWSIVLGSGLLIFTLIGASYAVFFIYRKRSTRVSKSPPPYYPEKYAIPEEIRTDADATIPDKDYRF